MRDDEKNGSLLIEGVVESIIYANSENGYTVCSLTSDDGTETVAVGIMPYLAEGEYIRAFGDFVVHPSYGKQFRVDNYEKTLPSDENSILKYLQSGAIKGIGKVTAQRIVERFGQDTLDVIENHCDWLADIKGISAPKAREISENYKAQFGFRSVMMFCADFFGAAASVRIYKKWGGAAIDMIRRNPYILCDEIHGIGFEKADAAALKLGLDKHSRERIGAAAKYVMHHNFYQNGHVYLPREKLIPVVMQLLRCGQEEVEDALAALEKSGDIVDVRQDGRRCIYSEKAYKAERYIAKKLDILQQNSIVLSRDDVGLIIAEEEKAAGLTYEKLQLRAIDSAVNTSVLILTGGPGTGKTTVVKTAISVFERMGYEVALAAPTGRAAKRMSEATGLEAKTIHRLLEVGYSDNDEPVFGRGEQNPLDEDVVIIDEASMIDLYLMEALLRALRSTARIILIGDCNQLPPVGAGYVLRDMIQSERFDTVELKHIFRQEQSSRIVTNAHAINRGEHIDLSAKDGDFFFLPRDNDVLTASTVAELCKTRLPRKYGKTVFDGIQVITPSRKGDCGTIMLNTRLQRELNPPAPDKPEKKHAEYVFRVGDKVMQTRNNYEIKYIKEGIEGVGIFNGDMGVITAIDLVGEKMTIDFDDRVADYDFSMLDDIELAYAITVHKSQGSEYPVVVIPMYNYSQKLLTRNLLYTAVTRAQNIAVLVGDADVVYKATDNNLQVKRYSGLGYLLGLYD